ncbi:hypothetical protein ONS95_006012 [Cadophora gregata]|uniref:uncharacterized protein n=1 Tax=Cadophora gregata TaxID=51156 RepID=UPI0026DAAFA1|nr:uncharacterized protein ONS95_006012 [Cadophora gregata]KAK0102392.1 hypothetical protein ONS95_006012 [Cadophora gregata]KAK0104016.1 hypothetical protein ONS96_005121 [Cadophora gregata f. sp. sojae]
MFLISNAEKYIPKKVNLDAVTIQKPGAEIDKTYNRASFCLSQYHSIAYFGIFFTLTILTTASRNGTKLSVLELPTDRVVTINNLIMYKSLKNVISNQSSKCQVIQGGNTSPHFPK